jgi:hypothetical protein
LSRLVRRAALPSTARVELHLHLAELRHHRGPHALLQGEIDFGENRAILRVERCACLFGGDAGLQASKQVGPIGTSVVEPLPAGHDGLAHRERHVHERPVAQRRPMKPFRSNAYDRQRLAVDENRPVDDVRSLTESPAPVVITQNGHSSASGLAIIVTTQ